MNKLMGFFELRKLDIPTVPWKEFKHGTVLDDSLLWTIRTALVQGVDLNLPRSVGKDSEISTAFAEKTLKVLKDNGMVIYYPYFIAEKSGTLNIFSNKIVIEAVKDDLWNLVTFSDRAVTIIINNNNKTYYGEKDFISEKELNELLINVPRIKNIFKEYLLDGKSVLLEWSYAYNCDKNKNIVGNKYLVFYEVRTV